MQLLRGFMAWGRRFGGNTMPTALSELHFSHFQPKFKILSAQSPYLVDAGLGVQEKQLDGGIVLQIGDAFNVEPGRGKAREVRHVG